MKAEPVWKWPDFEVSEAQDVRRWLEQSPLSIDEAREIGNAAISGMFKAIAITTLCKEGHVALVESTALGIYGSAAHWCSDPKCDEAKVVEALGVDWMFFGPDSNDQYNLCRAVVALLAAAEESEK